MDEPSYSTGNIASILLCLLGAAFVGGWGVGRGCGFSDGQRDAINGNFYQMRVETPEGQKFIELDKPTTNPIGR